MVGREGEGEGESDEDCRIVGRFVGGLLWATWFWRDKRKERGVIEVMLSKLACTCWWVLQKPWCPIPSEATGRAKSSGPVGADAHCRGVYPLSTCPLASLSLLAPPPPTKRRDGSSRAQMQGPLPCTVSASGRQFQYVKIRNTDSPSAGSTVTFGSG